MGIWPPAIPYLLCADWNSISGFINNTVAQAYRDQAREGWLLISARGGAQVKARTAPNAPKPEAATYRRRIEELIAQIQASGAAPSSLARRNASYC